MNEIVDKSTRYRQVCQLLLTLNLLINNLSSIFFFTVFHLVLCFNHCKEIHKH